MRGDKTFHYYDPIDQLDAAGQEFWSKQEGLEERLVDVKSRLARAAKSS